MIQLLSLARSGKTGPADWSGQSVAGNLRPGCFCHDTAHFHQHRLMTAALITDRAPKSYDCLISFFSCRNNKFPPQSPHFDSRLLLFFLPKFPVVHNIDDQALLPSLSCLLQFPVQKLTLALSRLKGSQDQRHKTHRHAHYSKTNRSEFPAFSFKTRHRD